MDAKLISRRVMLDKSRALSTARNPKESCLGQALLRNNVFEGRLLSGELGKIGEQSRRQQMHLEQQRKLFLKNHELPEPTILVDRPPSPEMMRHALFPELYDDDAYYFDPSLPPHYMKPLNSQTKGPSTLHTMDMYKVKTKKKVNVWEEVLIEKAKPRFESTVRPSNRLSTSEESQLQKGWSLQKRRLQTPSPSRPCTSLVLAANRNNSHIRSFTTSARTRKPSSRSKKKPTMITTEVGNLTPSARKISTSATFITELPEMRTEQDNGTFKSVSFVEDECGEVSLPPTTTLGEKTVKHKATASENGCKKKGRNNGYYKHKHESKNKAVKNKPERNGLFKILIDS